MPSDLTTVLLKIFQKYSRQVAEDGGEKNAHFVSENHRFVPNCHAPPLPQVHVKPRMRGISAATAHLVAE